MDSFNLIRKLTWSQTTLFFIVLTENLSYASSNSLISSRDILANAGRNYNKPEQVHITFGAAPTDVVIMWSSSVGEKSFVEYGNSPNSLARVESKIIELKEHSENSVKFVHRAELKGLAIASRYTYRIVNAVSEIKSETYRFDVPHNITNRHHTFMVLADMGLQSKSLHFVVHEALNNNYEAVIHIGDIAYNLGSGGGKSGDVYMNKIEKMAAQVPYLTTPGDHERFHDFYHYRHRFSTPGASWPMKEQDLWYSFNIGYAHFISLNTDYISNGSPFATAQLEWLEGDLKLANTVRQTRPWIVVLGHKPLYCTKSVMEQDCDKDESYLREKLEDLFYHHGVDLYLCGHKHCYERSWPMYKGHPFQTDYINPTAPVHVIIGAMGYEYLTDVQNSQASWLAFASSNHEKELFGNLTVFNATHLMWSACNAFNNELVDFVQIVQTHHGSFGEPGEEALKKLRPSHQRSHKLPPAPFVIIDEPPTSFFLVNRRYVLFFTVFSLSLMLFFFLRNSRIRKVLF